MGGSQGEALRWTNGGIGAKVAIPPSEDEGRKRGERELRLGGGERVRQGGEGPRNTMRAQLRTPHLYRRGHH